MSVASLAFDPQDVSAMNATTTTCVSKNYKQDQLHTCNLSLSLSLSLSLCREMLVSAPWKSPAAWPQRKRMRSVAKPRPRSRGFLSAPVPRSRVSRRFWEVVEKLPEAAWSRLARNL